MDISVIITSFWFQAVIKIILACLLSGIIGLERSSWNKPAGFRTHSLVGMSSVLVMLCGEYMAKEYNVDPSRIPAQLLSGIGFIGAGTILRDGVNVKGLTTAAGLLAVTCIGLCIGAGFYFGGIFVTILAYLILSYSYKISDKLDKFNLLELEIEISKNTNEVIAQVEDLFSEYNVDIKQIKRPKKDENELNSETIHIVGQYSKKGFRKNELFNSISSLPYIMEVTEE